MKKKIFFVMIAFLSLISYSNKIKAESFYENFEDDITREEQILFFDYENNSFDFVYYIETSKKWILYKNGILVNSNNESSWSYPNQVLDLNNIDYIKVIVKEGNTYYNVLYINNIYVSIDEYVFASNDNDSTIILNSNYVVIKNHQYSMFSLDMSNVTLPSFIPLVNTSGSLLNGFSITESASIEEAYYFEKLKNNFGDNSEGTCGYVAIATLLTYYNTFYNSDFIDFNKSEYNFLKTSSYHSLFVGDFIESPGYDDSFHQFFINEIGKNKLNFDQSLLGLNPMTTSRQKSVLEAYLEYYTSLSNDCIVSKGSTFNILNEIKSEVDNNRPVLITLSNWEAYYDLDKTSTTSNTETSSKKEKHELNYERPHVMIVYGYSITDSGEMLLDCHTGWKNNYHIAKIKPLNINSVNTLKFEYTSSTHKCSNNAYQYNHHVDCIGFPICICKDYFSDYCVLNKTGCTRFYYECPSCNRELDGFEAFNHDCEWTITSTSHSGNCSKCSLYISDTHTFLYDRKKEVNVCIYCQYTTKIYPTIKFNIPTEWLEEGKIRNEEEDV